MLTRKYGTDEIKDFLETNNKGSMFRISEDEEENYSQVVYSNRSPNKNRYLASHKKGDNSRLQSMFENSKTLNQERSTRLKVEELNESKSRRNAVDTELLADFENLDFRDFEKELKKLKEAKLKFTVEKNFQERTNTKSDIENKSGLSGGIFSAMPEADEEKKEKKRKHRTTEDNEKRELLMKSIEGFQAKKSTHLKVAVEVCQRKQGFEIFDSRKDVLLEGKKITSSEHSQNLPWKMKYNLHNIKSMYLLEKLKIKERLRQKRAKSDSNGSKKPDVKKKRNQDEKTILSLKTMDPKTMMNMMRSLEDDQKRRGESGLAKAYRETQLDFFPIREPPISASNLFAGGGVLGPKKEDRQYKMLVERLNKDKAKANKNFKNAMKGEDSMKRFFYDEFGGFNDERVERLSGKMERRIAKKRRKAEMFYETILEQDAEEHEISIFNWSIFDMADLEQFEYQKADLILNALSNEKLDIWLKGFFGWVKEIRGKVRYVLNMKWFDNVIFFLVVLNTVILSTEGLVSDKVEKIGSTINNVLTFIFLFEIVIKLFGFGVREFCRDKFNIFDTAVVLVSLVEFALRDNNHVVNAIRSVKIFKAFRVLRVTRLLRSLRFMKVIIEVIVSSLEQFTYIALLLLLCILISTLVGMQLYGGKFNFYRENEVKRQNFDNVGDAFLTVFQILTIENWNDVLYLGIRSGVNPVLTTVYLISWIFIGNYIFLNLFLAILLDGFTSSSAVQTFQEIENEDVRIENTIKTKLEALKVAEKEHQHKKRKLRNQKFGEVARLQTKQKEEDFTRVREIILENTDKESESIEEVPVSSDDSHQTASKQFYSEDLSSTDEDELLQQYLKKGVKNVLSSKKVPHVYCQNSLFLFSKNNKFREKVIRLVMHPWFERSILILIFFSSLKLMLDTYEIQAGSGVQKALLVVDDFFTACFIIEALLKIVCYGFVLCEKSYLRNPWFCLDFFIVMTSIVDLIFKDFESEYLKILLLLRTFRPLRFLSHYKNLRIVVLALLESIGGLINVMIVILMIWIMFGILGISLLKDKMSYCNLNNRPNYYGINITTCGELGGTWQSFGWNFDNIFNALVTLFILSSLEGWPNIMFSAIDADIPSRGPSLKANYWIFTFFILFVLVGSLFLMNLFVGVIFFQFTKEQDKEKNKSLRFMTEDQMKWIMMQQMISKATPNYEITTQPTRKWQLFLYKIFFSKYFDALMMLCIVLNTFVMGLVYEGMPTGYEDVINGVNLFFTVLFILEAFFKILSVGHKYFFSNWNKFDFLVAIFSLLDLTLSKYLNQKSFRIYPQIARVLKLLRITRLFKLMKSKRLEGFNKIVRTLVFAFPALFNVLTLLMLIYFIFSVMGVFVFQNTPKGREVFQNFGVAFLNLFRFSTGEDWHVSMYDIGEGENGMVSKLYFVTFTFFSSFVMINMFVLIIIQQFEDFYFDPNNPINCFEDIANEFREAWVHYADKRGGKRIRQDRIFDFFANLKFPMGYSLIPFSERKFRVGEHRFTSFDEMGICAQVVDIQRRITAMNLRVDKHGFVLFGQVLHAAMKNGYGSKIITHHTNLETYKLIKDMELKTMARILRASKDFRGKGQQTLSNGVVLARKKANPFMQMLYLSLVFQSWSKYTLKRMDDKDFIMFHSIPHQNPAVRFENEILRFIDDKSNSSRSIQSDQENQQILQENEEDERSYPRNDSKINVSKVIDNNSQIPNSEYLPESYSAK